MVFHIMFVMLFTILIVFPIIGAFFNGRLSTYRQDIIEGGVSVFILALVIFGIVKFVMSINAIAGAL